MKLVNYVQGNTADRVHICVKKWHCTISFHGNKLEPQKDPLSDSTPHSPLPYILHKIIPNRMVNLEKHKKTKSTLLKRELKDKSGSGVGFKLLYKRNRQQPTTTEHLFLKNPFEINFFLQVAQFIVEILAGIPKYVKGQGTVARKMEERTSLFLCASENLYTQSDPAVPWPGKDPDESSVDGWIYHVLSVCVIVKVPLKYL